MPSARDIKAGGAYVQVSAENTKLDQGLRKAQNKLKKFGAVTAGIGAKLAGFGVGFGAPLLAAVGKFAKAGDQLHKMNLRLGVSVERLSAWNHALELSGSDIETFERGIRNMQKNLFKVGQGLKGPTEALEEIGITLDDIKGLKPDDQFKAIGDAISKIDDPTKQTAIAFQLFGKAGADLLPLMKAGAAGMDQMMMAAKELGRTMTAEDAQAAADFEDAMTDLTGAVKGSFTQIAKALTPALAKLAELSSRYVVQISKWLGENKELTVTVAAVAAGLTAMGSVLIAVGLAASGASAALGVLGTIAGLLASPFVLGTAAALALGGAFLYATGALGEMVSGFKDGMSAMLRALSAGGIEAAWEALWISMGATSKDAIASILESMADMAETLTKNPILRKLLDLGSGGALGTLADIAVNPLRNVAKQQRLEATGLRIGRDAGIAALESKNKADAPALAGPGSPLIFAPDQGELQRLLDESNQVDLSRELDLGKLQNLVNQSVSDASMRFGNIDTSKDFHGPSQTGDGNVLERIANNTRDTVDAIERGPVFG